VITVAAGFIGVSWLAWAGVAAVASALFTVIQIPKQTPNTTGLTYLILRWAHSITWLLLALSFLIRALAPDLPRLADAVGLTALGTYHRISDGDQPDRPPPPDAPMSRCPKDHIHVRGELAPGVLYGSAGSGKTFAAALAGRELQIARVNVQFPSRPTSHLLRCGGPLQPRDVSQRKRSPKDRYVVRGQCVVGGHERHSEIARLRHEQPVKGITVMQRQVSHRPHLRTRYGYLMKAELCDDLRQVVRSAQLAGRALDRDLPQGDVAYPEPRRVALDVSAEPRRQPFVGRESPQQRMRIQQTGDHT